MQSLTSIPKRYTPSLLPRIKPLFNPQTPLSNHFSSNPPSPDFTPESVSQTISTYTPDWQRAFEFFNWVENTHNFIHTTTTYNQMIDVLGKSFEFDLAWQLIHKLNPPNHITFRILFKRYAAAHMVKEAIDCYNTRLDEFNLKDEISFFNLIDALCDYKHVIEAEELCKGYMNTNANTKLCNMILRGWFKMGWWSKCRECWEKMEVKDLHSYSIYMDIVCKSGKPWKTVKLYKEMKKKGIKLDVVAYNTVIRAVGVSDGVDMGMRIYREMIEMGCRPNVVTYNTLIKLLCQEGRLKHAYLMLDQMPEKGCLPDVITYHCLFSCSNQPKEMLKLFDRMVESGVRPRMDTYVMLMTKFGRWGFLRPVFVVWNKMKEHGFSPDAFAYNALIDALIQKGLLDMARKYDEEMLAKGLSAKPRKELGTKPLGELNYI